MTVTTNTDLTLGGGGAAATGTAIMRGSTDCSTNPNYPVGVQGDFYVVTVAGKIGGASGKVVDVDDEYHCLADNGGGNEATVGTFWGVRQGNIVGALTETGTQTATNKRITKRVVALTDAATVTASWDTTDTATLATLSQTTTFANFSGTPTSGQSLVILLKSTTSRALTFGAQFRASNSLALPTATLGSSITERWAFLWNAADSKIDLVAVDSWT
jgi:hypothetical protein